MLVCFIIFNYYTDIISLFDNISFYINNSIVCNKKQLSEVCLTKIYISERISTFTNHFYSIQTFSESSYSVFMIIHIYICNTWLHPWIKERLIRIQNIVTHIWKFALMQRKLKKYRIKWRFVFYLPLLRAPIEK